MIGNGIVILSLLLIGMALRGIFSFPEGTGTILNLFVIYLSLPALILLKVPDLVFSEALAAPLLTPWWVLVFSATIILFLSRRLNWQRPTEGCMMLLVPLGNTSFLGIPVIEALFGEPGIPLALIYDQLGTFLALSTYGTVVVSLYGGREGPVSLRGIIKKISRFPPFICLVIAILLKSFGYPPPLVILLKMLAETLVPLVMIAVGFQLTLRLVPEKVWQVAIGLSIKLLVAPVSAMIFLEIVGLNDISAAVSIVESGMPPMVSAGAIAIAARLDPVLASALVGIGIFFSFVTLPVIFHFLI